ncbi:MAG TPA: DEAD/DEAH box helicase [Armatimonadota bacterium]|nr:DEAD/DEAH box helicase [Armatimonadota bacterium]
MSEHWWRQKNQPRPTGMLSRLISPGDENDPPAALLRLPPVLAAGRPGHYLESLDQPAFTRDYRSEGYSMDTPEEHLGYTLLWPARSVDLRGLFLRFFAGVPGERRAGVGMDEDPDRTDDSAQRRPVKRDDLALRLFARLETPPEALLRASGPLEWPGSFFPYQQIGIGALVHSSHLLLGDEMGLGKTIQALAALRLLLHVREIEQALIVAPASLLQQWRQEILRWAPDLRVIVVNGPVDQRVWQWQYRAHVTLVSYDTLRADFTSSPSCGPRRTRWGVVVLDEAQRIKNASTDVARACKRLSRRRSWALTGTPLENSVEDVVSILEFVAGGSDPGPAPRTGLSLRASLSEYQLRRRKSGVLQDLPPKIVTDLTLELTPAQRRAYDRAENEGLSTLLNGAEILIENILALINQLKQICNFAPAGGASSKMEDLLSRMEELSANQQKALVFTQYTSDLSGARRIARELSRFNPLVYTGEMSLAKRAETVDRFRSEDGRRVLILSLKAGGQGLNLQNASYVFHFDRGWNPAVERQAEDRAHRLGQVSAVNVYRYIMAGTIEQRIDEILKSKIDLFEQMVEDASIDPERLLSKRDLLALFGLG